MTVASLVPRKTKGKRRILYLPTAESAFHTSQTGLFPQNVRSLSAQAAYPSACRSEFASRHKYLGLGKMCKAAVVVDVQMGQDDAPHITGPDADGA